MVAQRVWTPLGEAAIGGTGYSLDGDIVSDGRGVRAGDVTDLLALMKSAVLCTDAKVVPPDSEHPEGQVLGDPT
jgi:hypothetical protein